MSGKEETKKIRVNTSLFWHVVLPILSILILLFVLFVVYSMPDWALTCGPGLESMRRLATKSTS